VKGDAMTGSKIRLVQMEVLPGRPRENTARVLGHIGQARQAGVDVVAFPEMVLPGYLLGDEWERPAFLRECEACGHEVRRAACDLVVLFGNVAMDWRRRNEDGRARKFNALFVAQDGEFLHPEGSPYPFVIKTLMPNYREFDDSRHFYDNRKLAAEAGRPVRDFVAPVVTRAGRIGALLCEDAWDTDYGVSPLQMLADRQADWFVNASCSPFTFNKNHKRHRVFSAAAARFARPLAYVNNLGLQDNGKTVFTFDGGSCVYDGQGRVLAPLRPFEEGVVDLVLPRGGSLECAGGGAPPADDIGILCSALRYGAGRFMQARGITRVVVGASGGIDSAVTAALYRTFLPPENLLLANMPSRHNSNTTISLARDLARRLGCGYVETPIEDAVKLTCAQIDGLGIQGPGGTRTLALSEAMIENVQARDRSSRVLAALASAFGGVFTCNANKSEMTVGYTTLYGDLGGFLALLADLWKGEVYALGRHLNDAVFGNPVIPEGSFEIVPSAELSPAQAVDEGKGDPLVYPYHDCLFRTWVEEWNRATPEDILESYLAGGLEQRLGYEGRVGDLFTTPAAFVADLERWWNHYQGLGIAKRIQAPPVLAVKRRAYGFDHREAQLGARYTARYEALKRRALGLPDPEPGR
jgi:NAD+ synthase (glutamine-hydrolysing)